MKRLRFDAPRAKIISSSCPELSRIARRFRADRHLAAFALSASLLFAAARPAHAQTDSAVARALFAEGRTLMDKERYEEACPKFEESLRLDHGMGTQFNLAFCWEKLGRSASAWALFLDVAAAARAANQPKREAAARERAEALEPKLTRLRIAVTEAPEGTKVTRDGKEVGRPAWGTAVPVDPGDHVIAVNAPGKVPWSQEIKIPATARTFSVTVPVLEDELVSSSTAPAEPRADEASQSADPRRDREVSGGRGGLDGQQVAALVVGGVGIAAAAVGTAFAIQSNADNDEALKLCRLRVNGEEQCASGAERERHEKLVSDAQRELTIAYVGFGVGGAALVTAVVLYLTAGDDSERAALEVTPVLGGDVWGATLAGRF